MFLLKLSEIAATQGESERPQLIGSIISAGASLLGGALQNKSSAKAAQNANMFTTEQLKNRHQWEVDDLRKAGLNPILSAGGTPSIGSSAVADVVNPLGDSVNSAMAAKRLEAELKNLEATNDKIRSDVSLNKGLEQAAKADALLKSSSARVADVNASLLSSDLPRRSLIGDAWGQGHKVLSSARSMVNTFSRNPGAALKAIMRAEFPNPLKLFGNR